MSVAITKFDVCYSAVGAFRGVIRPSYRRVAASATVAAGFVTGLRLTAFLDDSVDSAALEDIREDISVAMTEIIADLPGDTPLPIDVVEDVRVIAGPLPTSLDDWVIFERWEASA